MGANGFTVEENKKYVTLFFKQIGLFNEFKEYCIYHNKIWEIGIFEGLDPLHCMGNASFTYWAESHKRICTINDYTFTDFFRGWLRTFYPNVFENCRNPHSKGVSKGIYNGEKKTINIKKIYRRLEK